MEIAASRDHFWQKRPRLGIDTVLMPWLVSDTAWKKMEARAVKLLFVGITRATGWVYFSSSEPKQLSALRRLLPLAERGNLTVRRDGDGSVPRPADSTSKKPSGPDLGFL